ncbi:hypothetical protein [uncultured Gimesia sp.]|uniref:hypothetical protein n=1 Tax=uncultured Gimesia sp. TaxID=1678688 RepID=UPI002623DBDE|nr:hypothetical protein [uncultured Gimesia sp.]
MPDINHRNDQLLQELNKSQAKPTCSECGTYEPWGLSSWCPQCGYYPKLGRCVGQSETQQQGQAKPQPQTVWELIPQWGWILAIGSLAAIGLSVGGRFYCASPGELCLWTLTQATVGLILFMIGHVVVYLNAVSKSFEFGMMSIFLTPLKIWRPTIRRFPVGAWKLDLAIWGLTLMVGAFAIVGGFEFNSLFQDWGVRKSANVNLLASVVDQAKEAEGGAENLEDALNDFAGGTDKAAEVALPLPAPEEAAPKLTEYDCLLVGYTTLPSGKIESVLLAASHNKQLVYAGSIDVNEIPEEVLEEWKNRLPSLKQSTPFVKVRKSATWIKPKITLKVASEGWSETSNRLIKPEYVSLLQEISVD